MAKFGGRVALYELVNKARFKSAQQKALEAIKPASKPASDSAKATTDRDAPLAEPLLPSVKKAVEKVVHRPEPAVKAASAFASSFVRTMEDKKASTDRDIWSVRPKPVRIYPDRVELCLSWQVSIIGLLAIVAVLLVFFRLGQLSALKKSQPLKVSPQVVSVEKVMPQAGPVITKVAPVTEQAKPKMVEPMGDCVIVIASHQLSSHLEPVKQYFGGFGIATEIIKKDNRWLLVTQERFDNPEKAGTNGFEMKKKIISIGANYRPPSGSGFEAFGPKPFQDAYGMKVN